MRDLVLLLVPCTIFENSKPSKMFERKMSENGGIEMFNAMLLIRHEHVFDILCIFSSESEAWSDCK